MPKNINLVYHFFINLRVHDAHIINNNISYIILISNDLNNENQLKAIMF